MFWNSSVRLYTGWFKQMDSVSYVFISWTIHGMWMIYIKFKRGSVHFQLSPLERSPSAQPSAASVESKMATMQHKIFCVYQRRTWDKFKRVFSVPHASQPVERAENLKYRNQLSGVCWGAVYCLVEFIFLNHPVFYDALPVFCMGVKLGLWHCGRKGSWGCSRT